MLSQMSTDETKKKTNPLEGLFFEQQLELNGGGFLDIRFNMDVNLEAVRIQKLFVDSRRLNTSQLVARYDGDKSRNIRGDKAILMSTMGYDEEQAFLTCDSQYKELIEMTWIDALVVAMLDQNFDQVYANDQIEVSFKHSVLYPASGLDPIRVKVPESYWDDSAVNVQRLSNGYVTYPAKTKGSPVERKLALITALLDQPDQKEVSLFFRMTYMKVVQQLGTIKGENVKREAGFQPRTMDNSTPKPPSPNGKGRKRK